MAKQKLNTVIYLQLSYLLFNLDKKEKKKGKSQTLVILASGISSY